ncbi:MAG: hypothetical protein AAGH15_28845 [Myxococcota bacterium]
MQEPNLPRDALVSLLAGAFEEAPWARAAFLGGSEATGRVDQWSDVDVHVIVEDGNVKDAFRAAERALQARSEIIARLRMPEPTWHGHSQCFYRVRDASPFALVDLVVMRRSAPDFYLQVERHGRPRVLFDRDGLVMPSPLDRDRLAERQSAHLAKLRAQHALFGPLIEKAVHRGHGPEAMHFYFTFTLRPLVDVLRMRFCPDRWDFGLRYLDRDLSADWAATLTRLAYVPDGEGLLARHREARAHFQAIVRELGEDDGNA